MAYTIAGKLKAKRQYDERRYPLTFYNDSKFTARYRLSKEVVKKLVQNYLDDMPAEKRHVRGKHGVPHSLKVGSYPISYKKYFFYIMTPPSKKKQ